MTSGILLLDKPRGLSSNAALQRVRALLAGVKAGHTGSLDPLATGMLPICLGEATKIAGEVISARKCYRFTIALGVSTATGDAEGAVIARAAPPALERERIESVLARFRGPGRQVPPMYSALKHAGRPLYRLARAGLNVERAARAIELSELRLLGLGPASLELETLCSKGTYIRVLAEDIAAALDTLGHVAALTRVYVEPFQGQPMHTLEGLNELSARAEWPLTLPADWALQHLPAVRLPAAAVRRLARGQRVAAEIGPAARRVRLYDESGSFLGIGEADGPGALRPRRLFNCVAPASASGCGQ